jgi:hypothetical protein
MNERRKMEPKFPNVVVKLSDEDGNAFSILARVLRALRQADVSEEDRMAFQKEAISSDYDHLLQTCMEYVEIE